MVLRLSPPGSQAPDCVPTYHLQCCVNLRHAKRQSSSPSFVASRLHCFGDQSIDQVFLPLAMRMPLPHPRTPFSSESSLVLGASRFLLLRTSASAARGFQPPFTSCNGPVFSSAVNCSANCVTGTADRPSSHSRRSSHRPPVSPIPSCLFSSAGPQTPCPSFVSPANCLGYGRDTIHINPQLCPLLTIATLTSAKLSRTNSLSPVALSSSCARRPLYLHLAWHCV